MSLPSVSRDYLEALLVAMVFALFARTFTFQAFKIPTGSMEPNLLVGDHILVNKFVFAPVAAAAERRWLPTRAIRRGDVVVFRFPEDPRRDFIKRCIGLPGDRIEIRAKAISVNGEPLREEGYASFTDLNVYPDNPFLDESRSRRDNFGPYTVPEGHYFFLGDNRDNSNDSRVWGAVPAGYVKGRALLVYWSFAGAAEDETTPDLGGKLWRLLEVATHFVGRTRWERSFLLVR
ncbi:MAG: signal peptidase I [Thermoanaerobaculia bacterium]